MKTFSNQCAIYLFTNIKSTFDPGYKSKSNCKNLFSEAQHFQTVRLCKNKVERKVLWFSTILTRSFLLHLSNWAHGDEHLGEWDLRSKMYKNGFMLRKPTFQRGKVSDKNRPQIRINQNMFD